MSRLPFADLGTPDLSSPTAYLRRLGRAQSRTLLIAIGFGIVWMVSQALFPAVMSRAIDDGVIGGDTRALALWCAALVGLVVLSAAAGALRHKYAVANWIRGAFRSAQLIGHKAADSGEALSRAVPTGDVVATVSSDAMRIGGLYDVTARFAGAVVSYVVGRPHPAADLRPARACRAHRRAGPRGGPRLHRASAPGTPARPARGGRPAHRPRRRHRGRVARPARHRGRAHLPGPVCRSVPVRADRRQSRGGLPGRPRRRPGPAAGHLCARRGVARRALRRAGRPHAGAAGRLLRLHRLPRHSAAHRHRDGRAPPAPTLAPAR